MGIDSQLIAIIKLHADRAIT